MRDRQLPPGGKTDPEHANLKHFPDPVSDWHQVRRQQQALRGKDTLTEPSRCSVPTSQREEGDWEGVNTSIVGPGPDESELGPGFCLCRPLLTAPLLFLRLPHWTVRTSGAQGPNLTGLFISGIHYNIWHISAERINK